jgi:hypothetical protein
MWLMTPAAAGAAPSSGEAARRERPTYRHIYTVMLRGPPRKSKGRGRGATNAAAGACYVNHVISCPVSCVSHSGTRSLMAHGGLR